MNDFTIKCDSVTATPAQSAPVQEPTFALPPKEPTQDAIEGIKFDCSVSYFAEKSGIARPAGKPDVVSIALHRFRLLPGSKKLEKIKGKMTFKTLRIKNC